MLTVIIITEYRSDDTRHLLIHPLFMCALETNGERHTHTHDLKCQWLINFSSLQNLIYVPTFFTIIDIWYSRCIFLIKKCSFLLWQLVQRCRNAYESGKTKSVAFREKQLKQLLKMYKENELEFTAALASDLRKVIDLVFWNRLRNTSILLPSWPLIYTFVESSILSFWCLLLNALTQCYVYSDRVR